MLFQHAHAVHDHGFIRSLAHVVNGQQPHLHGRQCFHFHAGLALGLHGGGAADGVGIGLQGKVHGHAGQCQRMAQGDEVAGFFRGHDGGNAGHAQHVALFGAAALHQGQGGGLHGDAALGHGNAGGAGFGTNVHHMGLALGVKVGEGGMRHGHGKLRGSTRSKINRLLSAAWRNFFPPAGLSPAMARMHKTRFFLAPLRTAVLALSLAWGGLAAQAQIQLPHLGDGAELSISEERALGDSIITSLYRDPDYIDDAPLHDYVMQVWQPLVQAALQRGDLSAELHQRFAWQVLLGKDRSINAFALPGGYLGVHLGLIGAVTSRDELATVLAHELSHVTQRHIARMFAEDKKNMPLLIGSMILGALAATKSPDAAQALIIGGQAATVQNQLSFSRDMEREADRVGFNLLTPAGFNPQGAASMFDKLQQASRLNDNGSWPYLRSHPLTSERIADMQARVPHGSAAPLRTTLEHAMIAARARVLAQPGVDRLRQWAEQVQQPEFAQQPVAQQVAGLYAAALAQQQLRDGAAAQALWRKLDALVQQDAVAQRQSAWLGAELALAAGQAQRALELVQPSAAQRPVARPALLLQAQALLALQRPAQVSDRLQTWVAQHPQDAHAWQLLGQAWQAQQQPLRALRAQAEAQVAIRDFSAAQDRLKAAQDLARRSPAGQQDYIEASIIDTRLRAVTELLREQARKD